MSSNVLEIAPWIEQASHCNSWLPPSFLEPMLTNSRRTFVEATCCFFVCECKSLENRKKTVPSKKGPATMLDTDHSLSPSFPPPGLALLCFGLPTRSPCLPCESIAANLGLISTANVAMIAGLSPPAAVLRLKQVCVFFGINARSHALVRFSLELSGVSVSKGAVSQGKGRLQRGGP